MKFDPDIARTIMLAVESHPDDFIPEPLDIPGLDAATYSFHCRLLGDAGHVAVVDYGDMTGHFCSPARITYQGVQFIETFRNCTLWENAKRVIREKGIEFTLDTLLAVVPEVVKRTFGQS